jgi:hypothetical protein
MFQGWAETKGELRIIFNCYRLSVYHYWNDHTLLCGVNSVGIKWKLDLDVTLNGVESNWGKKSDQNKLHLCCSVGWTTRNWNVSNMHTFMMIGWGEVDIEIEWMVRMYTFIVCHIILLLLPHY